VSDSGKTLIYLAAMAMDKTEAFLSRLESTKISTTCKGPVILVKESCQRILLRCAFFRELVAGVQLFALYVQGLSDRIDAGVSDFGRVGLTFL